MKLNAKSIISLIIGAIVVLSSSVIGDFLPSDTNTSTNTTTCSPSTDSDYSVHFIDVGQGDSTLLALNGQYILIDAGSGSESDEVIEYLTAQGVETIDAIIATHPHEDHIGSIDEVIESFEVLSLYLPNVTHTSQAYSNMIDAADNNDVVMLVPNIGDTLEIEGTTLTFLSPDPDEEFSNLNDYSLITMLECGNDRVLLVGDAEETVLEPLAESGVDFSCDIYKVGHHGSSNSSSEKFLQAASPSIAVISCGANNTYGHPHEDAVQRLNDIGATIRETAIDGTIVYPLDPPA